MNNQILVRPIGIIHSPHKDIEGVPIQPNSAKGIKGEIEIYNEFKDGLKDLERFSHIYLLYHFHKSTDFSLLVKPFLDVKMHGVFATRAPKRPNGIGISVLKLISIIDNRITVENVDILDGTPVLDIKPYVSKFDLVENEKSGWLENNIHRSDTKRSDDRFK